jgi:hypothetical protein
MGAVVKIVREQVQARLDSVLFGGPSGLNVKPVHGAAGAVVVPSGLGVETGPLAAAGVDVG